MDRLAGDVRVSIGELIVDGLAVDDRARFGEAVTAALSRLVTAGGQPAAGPSAPSPITVRHDVADGDRALAESVAGAIWSAMGPGGGGTP